MQGELDLERLEQVLTALVAEHEALRTGFPLRDGLPVQEVRAAGPFAIERLSVELDGLASTAREARVEAAIEAFQSRRFDLAEGPLLRAGWLPLAADQAYLLLSLHHLIADGRSVAILLDEIARRGAVGATLVAETAAAQTALQYRDYAAWSRSAEAQAAEAAALPFWREQLTGLAPDGLAALRLPQAARQAEAVEAGDIDTAPGDEVAAELPRELAAAVRAMAAREGVSESTVYLAAYGLLLARLGGEPEVLVGTAYAGRDVPGTAAMIGMFVNVLPLRVTIGDGTPFARQLHDWREASVAAWRHARLGYGEMVELAGVERAGGAGELVRAMFDYEEREFGAIGFGAATLALERRTDRSAKFDLTLRCRAEGEAMRIALNHRLSAFDRERATLLLDTYRLLLEQVVAAPELTPAQTRVVDVDAAEALLALGRGFGFGEAGVLSGEPIHHHLERIARLHPEALAVTGADAAQGIAYGAFNAQANRLARRLRARSARCRARPSRCASRRGPASRWPRWPCSSWAPPMCRSTRVIPRRVARASSPIAARDSCWWRPARRPKRCRPAWPRSSSTRWSPRPPAWTARISTLPSRSTTWPTWSTPRAPPARPRAWRSRIAAWPISATGTRAPMRCTRRRARRAPARRPASASTRRSGRSGRTWPPAPASGSRPRRRASPRAS